MSEKNQRIQNTLRDVNETVTKALPNAASTAVTSDALEAGEGVEIADMAAVLELPALNATMVPDTRTVTCEILQGNEDGSELHSLGTVVLTSDGGGLDAGEAMRRRGTPGLGGYFYFRVTSGASTANMSALALTGRLVH